MDRILGYASLVRRLCVAAGFVLIGCGRPGPEQSPTAASGSATVTPSATVSAAATASASAAAPAAPAIRAATEGPFDVVDLHVDTPWQVHLKDRPVDLPEGHATPELLRRGHYLGIVYPIYIPDYLHDHHPTIADADAIFATIDKIVERHEMLYPATAGQPPAGGVAVFVSIEGAGAFAEDPTQIDRFIARGVRLVGPVHSADSALAGSATGKKRGGLTDAGKALCRRVYAAGALVDVSHMSDAGFDELVPIAAEFDAPIVATHSNARQVANVPRNLGDDQLRVIARTGGVAGLNLHHSFVGGGKPKMKQVVAQVKHMVEVAGVDHVALGTDFDGGTPVKAVGDAGGMQDLAKALLDAGLSDSDVRKIFAANALRILAWHR
jgi:membrane dipeptidase